MARIVHKLEGQLEAYPKQRNWQLERSASYERQRRKRAEDSLRECRDRLRNVNDIHGSIIEVNSKLEVMAGQIADQLAPANQKVMEMKQ